MIRDDIEQAVKKALESFGVGDTSFVVERPGDMAHGDYSTNAALIAGKMLKKNPREVAEELAKILRLQMVWPSLADRAIAGELGEPRTFANAESLPALSFIEKTEVAGAGFINFTLSHEARVAEVSRAATDDAWGKNNLYDGKKVMVEYTDPNPFKAFHIGHLMSNAIGESIARVLEVSGAKVVSACWQGDVGLHVAKALWGIQRDVAHLPQESNSLEVKSAFLGGAYVAGATAYDDNADAKAEIDAINKKVFDRSDAELHDLYAKGRAWSLEHFAEIYKTLGTHFDYYFFEGTEGRDGEKIVREFLQKGVFEESDGAIVFPGEKYGLHTRVFITSRGLPTYEAKELGLNKAKFAAEPGLDESIIVTASEQNDYFTVALKAMSMIFPDIARKTKHVSHGMMRFAAGKMSSRRGNVITGESLLADLADAAKEKMKDRKLADADGVAQAIAVGAIKYAVLKQGSGKDIIFDSQKALSLEGDSGPYLQYAHVRALSLIKMAKDAGIETDTSEQSVSAEKCALRAARPSPTHFSTGTDYSEEDPSVSAAARHILERTLLHFPEILERAAKELEPHHITTYLTELASAFNAWYAAERIIGGEHPQYGLLLAEAVEKTLLQGLNTLGIPVPEEM